MPNLSNNFTLKEALRSAKAEQLGIDNKPDRDQLTALYTSAFGMELVRRLLGNKPITPSSWFRSKQLNAAIGGSKTSDHMTGYAVDFACPAFGTPAHIVQAIRDSIIPFDQLILERVGGKEWVHISFAPAFRMQVKSTVNGVNFDAY